MQMCIKQGPNIKKKHWILVKDLISSIFFNANKKKQSLSNSEMLRQAKQGRNVKIHSTSFYTAPFGYKLKLSVRPNGDGSGKNLFVPYHITNSSYLKRKIQKIILFSCPIVVSDAKSQRNRMYINITSLSLSWTWLHCKGEFIIFIFCYMELGHVSRKSRNFSGAFRVA